jgi:hypothetical protein
VASSSGLFRFEKVCTSGPLTRKQGLARRRFCGAASEKKGRDPSLARGEEESGFARLVA